MCAVGLYRLACRKRLGSREDFQLRFASLMNTRLQFGLRICYSACIHNFMLCLIRVRGDNEPPQVNEMVGPPSIGLRVLAQTKWMVRHAEPANSRA